MDNCLRFGPDGEILGRNGGVKAWLREHAPELFCRYKTLMRYKALARRLRQAAGIADPVPASAVFDGPPAPPRLPAPFVPSTPLRSPAPAAGREDAPETGDGHGPTGGDVSAGWTEKGRRDAQDYYAVKSHLAAARPVRALRPVNTERAEARGHGDGFEAGLRAASSATSSAKRVLHARHPHAS